MNLSIVIPAYNSKSTIISALDSVYNQTLLMGSTFKFEVIVVNDGSTDETNELVESYKISNSLDNLLLFNRSNSGVSKTRNYGIKKSKGQWIALLDSDDVWNYDKLEKQFDIINNNADIDFIGCARNNEILKIWGKEIDDLYEASVSDLLITMFPQTSTALIKRSLINRVGLYNESMTHAEDGELWVRLCNAGRFFYHPDSLVITGGGKNSFGESGLSADLDKMYKGNIQILDYCRSSSFIGNTQYKLLRLFYMLKHYRRVVIVHMR